MYLAAKISEPSPSQGMLFFLPVHDVVELSLIVKRIKVMTVMNNSD